MSIASLKKPIAAPDIAVGEAQKVWTDFLDANPDNLTSPEDLPDHALVTFEQFYAMHLGLAALTATKAPAEARVDPEHWPERLTPELRALLGLMCFQLAGPAHVYQKAGEYHGGDSVELRKRAEDEQAFMLHKLIGFWSTDKSGWARAAQADLNRVKALAQPVTRTDERGRGQ